MLAKEKRLPPFRFRARPVKTLNSQFLSLKYLGGTDRGRRAAVIVPRGIARTAVVRNRLRRAVLGALALCWDELPPGDILAVLRLGAAKAEMPSLMNSVAELAKGLNF